MACFYNVLLKYYMLQLLRESKISLTYSVITTILMAIVFFAYS